MNDKDLIILASLLFSLSHVNDITQEEFDELLTQEVQDKFCMSSKGISTKEEIIDIIKEYIDNLMNS